MAVADIERRLTVDDALATIGIGAPNGVSDRTSGVDSVPADQLDVN